MKRILPYIIVLLVGAVIGWLCRPNSIERIVDIQRDTIVKIDTHIVEKPVVVQTYIKDSLLIEVRDTIRLMDTLYISLPREVKVYAGDEYYAEVSGYRPNLDYIEIYPKTTTITQTIAERMPKNFVSAGIEAQYINAFALPIYAEYERIVLPNVGIYGRGMYDLHTKMFGAGVGARFRFGW